jgi:hypothetical protein
MTAFNLGKPNLDMIQPTRSIGRRVAGARRFTRGACQSTLGVVHTKNGLPIFNFDDAMLFYIYWV